MAKLVCKRLDRFLYSKSARLILPWNLCFIRPESAPPSQFILLHTIVSFVITCLKFGDTLALLISAQWLPACFSLTPVRTHLSFLCSPPRVELEVNNSLNSAQLHGFSINVYRCWSHNQNNMQKLTYFIQKVTLV